MSVSAIRPAAPVVRRPVAAAPVAAAAKPVTIVAPIKAQAGAKPEKFDTIEAYKAYVSGSTVSQLPTARSAVAKAQAAATAASQALDAKLASLRHDDLKAALNAAEKALGEASFPHKAEGAAKRAQADAVKAEIASLSRRIADAQSEIARAEGRSASRNRDFWWGNDKDYDGWDAAVDIIGSIGDSSAISSARRRIATLVSQKVELETKAITLVAEGAALERLAGDPAAIAAARSKRDAAQSALNSALEAASPEQRALTDANRVLGGAKDEQMKLEALKAELQDYDKQFGFTTRVGFKFSNWSWKKDLAQFWAGKGW